MSKDLYIKNIAPEATEEELRKLFSVCGKVSYIHMVRDERSGQFLGCAYIKMSSESEARDAIVSLDGAWFFRKLLVVCEALPQRPKGSTPPARLAAERGRTGNGKRTPSETPRKHPKKR
jgi:RNA recognition motif-containing protein